MRLPPIGRIAYSAFVGHSRRALTALAMVLVGATALSVLAQAQGFCREGSFPPRWAPDKMRDGRFVLCRLAYRRVRAEQSGIGWMTDYPYAEINLTTRFSELTRTSVSRTNERAPNHYSVRL